MGAKRNEGEARALAGRIAFLEGCLGELAAQRELAQQRAANLAGEAARLRALLAAGEGKETE